MTRRMTLVNFDRTPIRPTNRIHPTAGGTREMTQNFIYYPRYAGEKATALVKMYIMSSNLLRTLSSVLISDRGKQQTKEKAEERKRTQKGPVGRQVCVCVCIHAQTYREIKLSVCLIDYTINIFYNVLDNCRYLYVPLLWHFLETSRTRITWSEIRDSITPMYSRVSSHPYRMDAKSMTRDTFSRNLDALLLFDFFYEASVAASRCVCRSFAQGQDLVLVYVYAPKSSSLPVSSRTNSSIVARGLQASCFHSWTWNVRTNRAEVSRHFIPAFAEP